MLALIIFLFVVVFILIILYKARSHNDRYQRIMRDRYQQKFKDKYFSYKPKN